MAVLVARWFVTPLHLAAGLVKNPRLAAGMSPLLHLSLPVCLTVPSFSPLLCRVPAHVTVVCRPCMHLRWTSDSLHIAYVVCIQVVVFFFQLF